MVLVSLMSTSITIHNLDEELATRIRLVSRKKGKSLNQTVKDLLRQALGVRTKKDKTWLDNYSGTWTQEEYEEFQGAMKFFDKIDEDMWK